MSQVLNNAANAYNAILDQFRNAYGSFYAMESVAFPGIYLYMTGWGGYNDAGSGQVSGTYCTGPEKAPWFIGMGSAWGEAASTLEKISDAIIWGSTQTVAIAPPPPSPGAYLRMAGYGITQFQDAGAGTVNCQTSAGPWEEFRVEQQPDGTAAIASVAFPGVYLRMDGQGITQQQGACEGTVNCQYGVGPWEKFRIHDVMPPYRSTNPR